MTPILRQLDPANALTLLGASLALSSCAASLDGRLHHALAAIAAAALVDALDGPVARRGARRPLPAATGAWLDALADACSFGLAPAVWVLALGLHGAGTLAATAYFVAALLRLAHYGADGSPDRPFVGLPAPAAATLLAGFGAGLGWLVPEALPVALPVASLGCALAMVVAVPVPRPRGPAAWVLAAAVAALGVALLLSPPSSLLG